MIHGTITSDFKMVYIQIQLWRPWEKNHGIFKHLSRQLYILRQFDFLLLPTPHKPSQHNLQEKYRAIFFNNQQ